MAMYTYPAIIIFDDMNACVKYRFQDFQTDFDCFDYCDLYNGGHAALIDCIKATLRDICIAYEDAGKSFPKNERDRVW